MFFVVLYEFLYNIVKEGVELKHKISFIFFVVIILIILSGCSSNQPEEIDAGRETDEKNIAKSESVNESTESDSELSEGSLLDENLANEQVLVVVPLLKLSGSIENLAKKNVSSRQSIIKAGDLMLSIPEESFMEPVDFKISAKAITGLNIEGIEAISPLYAIENTNIFSNKSIELSFEFKNEKTSYPMAFYYDSEDNEIEMIPSYIEDGFLKIHTNHFSNIFIAQMSLEQLEKVQSKTEIMTGFTPGVDDFSFANHGSYPLPGGHCEGQSVGALWYFKNIRQKSIDDPSTALYNLYDNNDLPFRTPEIWEDDSWLYRFASSVHLDVVNSSYLYAMMYAEEIIDSSGTLGNSIDQNNWDAFYTSMMLTGRPQLIGIYSGGSSGHAMIAYGIKENKLYVADPNYPGQERYIEFEDGQFKPYSSGADFTAIDAGDSVIYDEFYYLGEFSTVDEYKVEMRWKEVSDGVLSNEYFPHFQILSDGIEGVIGHYDFIIEVPDGIFPDYTIKVIDSSGTELALYDQETLEAVEKPYHLRPYIDKKTMYLLPVLEEDYNWIGFMFEGQKPHNPVRWAGFEWVKVFNDMELMMRSEKNIIGAGETTEISAFMESGINPPDLYWTVNGASVENYSNKFTFASNEIGFHKIVAKDSEDMVSAETVIEVSEYPIEPVKEITEDQYADVKGTYSCTFWMSGYEAVPWTDFHGDIWYTAEQRIAMAAENAKNSYDDYSKLLGQAQIDRDNFSLRISEDGIANIAFSDFLGFNTVLSGVRDVPFNGGNVTFSMEKRGMSFQGIIQFTATPDGADMYGRISRISPNGSSMYDQYITYEFEGSKLY